MVEEAIEKKLFDAASHGDVIRLKELLQEDPHLLHRVSFACSRNVLHVATMHGQLGIVEEVADRNPELARELDSNMSSPLHIAAAHRKPHIGIASKLKEMAPEALWWRDCHGMNPVHIAAMNGHVQILEELIRGGNLPAAMERVHRGQTVLHLCVKHRQLPALKVLVEKLRELVDVKDDDGDTLLHLAVRTTDPFEIIVYLVDNKLVEKRTRNSMGKTALQILVQNTPRHVETEIFLLSTLPGPSMLDMFSKFNDMMLVVLVLIATMAFQAAVSPPGGVWQDDTSSHKAGKAVMASAHPQMYTHFLRANTTAFVLSILAIFLITTGPPDSSFVVLLASVAEKGSMAAIAVSYVASTTVMTPNTEAKSPAHIVAMVVAVAISIYVFTTLSKFIYMFCPIWRRLKQRRQPQPQHQLITFPPGVRRAASRLTEVFAEFEDNYVK